jgi:hypothetical protein
MFRGQAQPRLQGTQVAGLLAGDITARLGLGLATRVSCAERTRVYGSVIGKIGYSIWLGR